MALRDCKRDFSVRKGTVFEESRLPLRKWFAAIWLVAVNRKGIPSTQLAREIGVSQKTAWFMLGRLREVTAAMNGLVDVISSSRVDLLLRNAIGVRLTWHELVA